GLGAGGGLDTPYAAEQVALGRAVPGSKVRRQWVEDTVARVHEVWTGSAGGATGFVRPHPPPPIIIGGFGPKMAELAGRVGDGMNAPGGGHLGQLIEIARDAHARSGRDPADFVVTASSGPRGHQRLAELGVSRVIIYVRPPTPTVWRKCTRRSSTEAGPTRCFSLQKRTCAVHFGQG